MVTQSFIKAKNGNPKFHSSKNGNPKFHSPQNGDDTVPTETSPKAARNYLDDLIVCGSAASYYRYDLLGSEELSGRFNQ